MPAAAPGRNASGVGFFDAEYARVEREMAAAPSSALEKLFADLDAGVRRKGRSPRMAANMRLGSVAAHRLQVEYYAGVASRPGIRTICEVGFNAGHSAAVWLTANPQARLVAFDLFLSKPSQTNLRLLKSRFPGRITARSGDARSRRRAPRGRAARGCRASRPGGTGATMSPSRAAGPHYEPTLSTWELLCSSWWVIFVVAAMGLVHFSAWLALLNSIQRLHSTVTLHPTNRVLYTNFGGGLDMRIRNQMSLDPAFPAGPARTVWTPVRSAHSGISLQFCTHLSPAAPRSLSTATPASPPRAAAARRAGRRARARPAR